MLKRSLLIKLISIVVIESFLWFNFVYSAAPSEIIAIKKTSISPEHNIFTLKPLMRSNSNVIGGYGGDDTSILSISELAGFPLIIESISYSMEKGINVSEKLGESFSDNSFNKLVKNIGVFRLAEGFAVTSIEGSVFVVTKDGVKQVTPKKELFKERIFGDGLAPIIKSDTEKTDFHAAGIGMAFGAFANPFKAFTDAGGANADTFIHLVPMFIVATILVILVIMNKSSSVDSLFSRLKEKLDKCTISLNLIKNPLLLIASLTAIMLIATLIMPGLFTSDNSVGALSLVSVLGVKQETGNRASIFEMEKTNANFSVKKNFNDWNGIAAFSQEGISLFQTNPSKFFPEDPEDFIKGVRNYLRTGKISAVRVDIDITNFCNNDCIMCFNKEFRKECKVKIPRDRVIYILENLASLGVKSLRFTGGGESLTHPHFAEFLEKAYDLGFKITLETNGDELNSKNIRLLCKYATHVRVSINSGTDTTRAIVHKNKSAKKTLEALKVNMLEMVKVRKEMGRENDLMLGATFLIMPQNYDEVERFISLMHYVGFDWVAVRKTFDQSFYRNEPDKFLEALTQFERSKKKYASLNFKIVGPYGVSYEPKQDFDKCLIAATRLVILADSTANLCCLARSVARKNSGHLNRISMGKIGNGKAPVETIIKENKEKIDRFFKTAPSFCKVCIDSDFNIFLNKVSKLLTSDPKASFAKIRVIFYNGSKVIIGNTRLKNEILPVFVPYAYNNKFRKGEFINVNSENTTVFVKDSIDFLQEYSENYARAKQKIKEMPIVGSEKAKLYTALDRKILSVMKEAYLKSSTNVLVSGGVNRNWTNFYSDFDILVVENEGRDPGVGPFLNALKTVTKKTIKPPHHGTKEEFKIQFLNNPYQRITMIDSAPLDTSKTLMQVLGLENPEEILRNNIDSALFYVINNIVTEQKPEVSNPADINFKYDVGLLKYFSYFLTTLKILSIPLSNQDKKSVEEYLDFMISFKDEVQCFYGKETNVIGEEFIEYLKVKKPRDMSLEAFMKYRKIAQKMFNKYLPDIFKTCQEGIPALEGYDLSVIRNKGQLNAVEGITEKTPEQILNFYTAFSQDEAVLRKVFKVAEKSYWATFFFLARNRYLPASILAELSQMQGILNRDIRYEAVKNPNADKNIWQSSINDLHSSVVRVSKEKLGMDKRDLEAVSLQVDAKKSNFWAQDLKYIFSVIFDKVITKDEDRQKIAESKKSLQNDLASDKVFEYNFMMGKIFQDVNQTIKDPFGNQRTRLNDFSLKIYEANKSLFEGAGIFELLMLSNSFNSFDGLLKNEEVDLHSIASRLFENQKINKNLSTASELLGGSQYVGIVLDNYGELLVDLLLSVRLLKQDKSVRLFTRASPFMISDVTQEGLEDFIDKLVNTPCIRDVGLVLQSALEKGQLEIIATDAFCDGKGLYVPEKLNILREFADLDSVIIKGDWNYKMSIGMKNWNYNTPLAETDLQFFPTNAILLRTVKSPIIVGEDKPFSLSKEPVTEIKVLIKKDCGIFDKEYKVINESVILQAVNMFKKQKDEDILELMRANDSDRLF